MSKRGGRVVSGSYNYDRGETSPAVLYLPQLGVTVATYQETPPVAGVIRWTVEFLDLDRCPHCGHKAGE